jgi:hypothetical protein
MERLFHSRAIASSVAALGLAIALCFELASAACAANKFVVVSDTNNCVSCTAGSRCDGTTLIACGNGQWSAWSVGSCSACTCAPGSYCNSAPSATLNCNSCPAGFFCVNSQQQACPAGVLQWNCGVICHFIAVRSLTWMAAGTWSAAGSTVCTNCNCPTGTGCTASSSVCTICSPGALIRAVTEPAGSYCYRVIQESTA